MGEGDNMTIRVLLADDHAVVRDGLKALLQVNSDISVVCEVSNGREAVQRSIDLKPDVTIMDIAMPDLNGIEATRLLLAAYPETRVVMLSMYSDAESVYRALDAGASGYVLKEAAGMEVTLAVRTVHSGRIYMSRSLASLEPARKSQRTRAPGDATGGGRPLQCEDRGADSSFAQFGRHLS
jgi:DNA-binding NarL/FixJ family response regulator